jgi:hypothetical protein
MASIEQMIVQFLIVVGTKSSNLAAIEKVVLVRKASMNVLLFLKTGDPLQRRRLFFLSCIKKQLCTPFDSSLYAAFAY